MSGGGGTIDWGAIIKKAAPYVAQAGVAAYGAHQQNEMMEDAARAQEESYGRYAEALNPPESVKQARFNEEKSKIIGAAPMMQKRLADTMASRGVRGQGKAASMAGMERDKQNALNQAWRSIYGQYNVPQIAPPVGFVPKTRNLWGKDMSDWYSTLLSKNMV